MEDDNRPQLNVQGDHGIITGPVDANDCFRCTLRDPADPIISCNGYPTKEKPAVVTIGKYGSLTDVLEQALCAPELVLHQSPQPLPAPSQ